VIAEGAALSQHGGRLPRQPSQEVALVHAVLEGFASVDEHDGDFVGKLAAKFVIAVHVDFLQAEPTAAMQLAKCFLDDLAEVASLTGVDHDLARRNHGAECSK